MKVCQYEGDHDQALPKSHVISKEAADYSIGWSLLVIHTPGESSALVREELGLDRLAGLHLLLQHRDVEARLESSLHQPRKRLLLNISFSLIKEI